MSSLDKKYKDYESLTGSGFKNIANHKKQFDTMNNGMDKSIANSITNINKEIKNLDASLEEDFSKKINQLTKKER